MQRLELVTVLILCGGGAGGFANYLLQPPEKGEWSFWGAVRFIIAGAIVALAVPLFLSPAQSSLIKGIFETAQGAQGDQFYQNILLLTGFCVVAGFASRRFIEPLAARIMQAEQAAQKAEEKSEKARETSEEAVELVEESIDRVADAGLSVPLAKKKASKQGPISAEAERLGSTLSSEERTVVTATGLHDKRTLTGIARDAHLPRHTVKRIVPKLIEQGVLEYTRSANTGGTRVRLTSTGVDIANRQATDVFTYTVPSAEHGLSREEKNEERETESTTKST